MAQGQGNRWNCVGKFEVIKVTYKESQRREHMIDTFVGNARHEQGSRQKPVYYYSGQSGMQKALDLGDIEHYWYRLVEEL